MYSLSSIQNINKCGSGTEIALHNLINHLAQLKAGSKKKQKQKK